MKEKSKTESSEEKYRNLVENVSDIVYEIGSQGVVIYINPIVKKILGYDSTEVVGRNFIEFVHKDDRSRLMKRFIELVDGIEYPFEYRLINKSGGIRWVRTKTNSVMKNGSLKGILIDITERKETEEKTEELLIKLKKSLTQLIEVLLATISLKDPYTANHQKRMASLAVVVAKKMGLTDEQVGNIQLAALVHDIGKMGLPIEILGKQTGLSKIERSLFEDHVQTGVQILESANLPEEKIARIVLQHHERLDGSGYPNKLRGGEIMVEARILAVADKVESKSSYRPWRETKEISNVLAEIERGKGILYDSAVVDACLEIFKEGSFKFD